MTLSDLAAASDLNIKMAAVMVDKMLKEVVLETEQGKSSAGENLIHFFKERAAYLNALNFCSVAS